MRRKFYVLVTLVALAANLLFPLQAMATYDRDLERAISTVKSKINIPAELDRFNYNIYRDTEQTVFNLSWEDSKNKLGSVNVTINSAGRITNYNSYKPYNQEQKKLPSLSKSDALKVADNFIKKVNPEFVNNIKYVENTLPVNINDRSYNFVYNRIENGIAFPENNISVSVDSMAGDVQNYYCNWNESFTFPDPNGAISLEDAKKVFAEKLGLKLVYKTGYDQNNQKPYLAYTNVYANSFIDAKTGDVIRAENYFGPYYGGTKDMGGMGTRSEANNVNLTPDEQKAVENAGNLIDQQKAEETARNIFKIDSSFKLANVNLYSNWSDKDEYTWNLEFSKQQNNSYNGISVTIDAKKGDILGYYRSLPYEEKAVVKYDEEKAKKIAEDFIQKLQPERFTETELTDWENYYTPVDDKGQVRQSQFNYTRKTNGAYFVGNGINVTVDNTNGQVTGFSVSWYNKELPAADNIISLEDAYKVLYEKIGFQLQYVSKYAGENADAKIMPVPNPGQKKEIKLVYAINPAKLVNLDAKTGKELDYSGKPIDDSAVKTYKDIKGNFAENQIKVLAEYGIALPGEELKPNQVITQKEFLYLLQKSVDPYVQIASPEGDDDVLYNSLINLGIVKEGEKAPKSAITREEAVKYIVRALNYDKLAESSKSIFVLPFKDAKTIKAANYGYVAVAYGLNIVGGNDGNFNPTGSLTRAQGLVLIYNFLNVN